MSGSNDSNDSNFPFLKPLATIVKEIGITGFLVIVLTSVFLIFGTSEQKQEFIDHFILLKPTEYNLNCYFVILALLFISISGAVFCRARHKASKAEIIRIGIEKSDLQAKLLNKKTKRKAKR